MHSILQKIVIETPPEMLFQALTTTKGLSHWWTKAEGRPSYYFFLWPER